MDDSRSESCAGVCFLLLIVIERRKRVEMHPAKCIIHGGGGPRGFMAHPNAPDWCKQS